MPKKSRTQKGNSSQLPLHPLERFPNPSREHYEIRMTCPEFTCLCPKTGFPDFGTIWIRYVPDRWCVELKSLKLYINSYRNVGSYHEGVTNRILGDLESLLAPAFIEVTGDFNVRGNIKTVVTVRRQKVRVRIPGFVPAARPEAGHRDDVVAGKARG